MKKKIKGSLKKPVLTSKNQKLLKKMAKSEEEETKAKKSPASDAETDKKKKLLKKTGEKDIPGKKLKKPVPPEQIGYKKDLIKKPEPRKSPAAIDTEKTEAIKKTKESVKLKIFDKLKKLTNNYGKKEEGEKVRDGITPGKASPEKKIFDRLRKVKAGT